MTRNHFHYAMRTARTIAIFAIAVTLTGCANTPFYPLTPAQRDDANNRMRYLGCAKLTNLLLRFRDDSFEEDILRDAGWMKVSENQCDPRATPIFATFRDERFSRYGDYVFQLIDPVTGKREIIVGETWKQ